MLGWAALGAVLFAVVIFSARMMRRGLPTLDDDRKAQYEKMTEMKRSLAEDRKKISAEEHLYIVRKAVADLISLDRLEGRCQLENSEHGVLISTPEGEWKVELKMRELHLKSSHKTLHGQGRWLLCHNEECHEFAEIGPLMAELRTALLGKPTHDAIPQHIARRIQATRKAPGLRKRNI